MGCRSKRGSEDWGVEEDSPLSSCSRCDVSVSEGLVFCPSCGQPVGGALTGPAPEPAAIIEDEVLEDAPEHAAPGGSVTRVEATPGPAPFPVATPPGPQTAYGPLPSDPRRSPWHPGPSRDGPNYAPPWPRTTGWATWGFVFAFLCAPFGLLFSIIALTEIRRSNGRIRGEAYAIMGILVSSLILMMTFAGRC